MKADNICCLLFNVFDCHIGMFIEKEGYSFWTLIRPCYVVMAIEDDK